jgi:hypothetical protein
MKVEPLETIVFENAGSAFVPPACTSKPPLLTKVNIGGGQADRNGRCRRGSGGDVGDSTPNLLGAVAGGVERADRLGVVDDKDVLAFRRLAESLRRDPLRAVLALHQVDVGAGVIRVAPFVEPVNDMPMKPTPATSMSVPMVLVLVVVFGMIAMPFEKM